MWAEGELGTSHYPVIPLAPWERVCFTFEFPHNSLYIPKKYPTKLGQGVVKKWMVAPSQLRHEVRVLWMGCKWYAPWKRFLLQLGYLPICLRLTRPKLFGPCRDKKKKLILGLEGVRHAVETRWRCELGWCKGFTRERILGVLSGYLLVI